MDYKEEIEANVRPRRKVLTRHIFCLKSRREGGGRTRGGDEVKRGRGRKNADR